MRTKNIVGKIKNKLQRPYFPVLIMCVIVFAQVINIVNVLGMKRGFHADEMYSYGLSDSYYMPFIDAETYKTYSEDNPVKNVNEWVSSEVLRNYITVQYGEQFSYGSVWYNQSMDRHPPLYYAVLHTICSFFPDSFSVWYGLMLNFVCFTVMQIFLYLLSKDVLRSRWLAVLVCLLWGFSVGAVNMTIFIRMYTMLAMWTVVLFYLHSRLYRAEKISFKRHLLPIIAITACGALTQYLFWFIAFVLAVFTCIRFLIKKMLKSFFAYGFSMAGGIALAVAIFPYSLIHVFVEKDDSVGDSLYKIFRLSIKYCFEEVFPVDMIMVVYLLKVIPAVLISVLIMIIPVIYLFRDKKTVIKLISDARELPVKAKAALRGLSVKSLLRNKLKAVKKTNYIVPVAAASIVVIAFITARRISFYMILEVERYMFIVFPIFAMLIVWIISLVPGKKGFKVVFAYIAVIAMIIYMPSYNTRYFFDEYRDIDNLRELTKDSECIIVMNNLYDSCLIESFSNEIFDSNDFFLTNLKDQNQYKDRIEEIGTEKPVYLMVDEPMSVSDKEDKECYIIQYYNGADSGKISTDDFEKQYIDFYKKLSITKQFEYLGRYQIYSHKYMIWRL